MVNDDNIEIRRFDLRACPFCGCAFNLHLDHYWDFRLEYHTYSRWLFKCHRCNTVFGVSPAEPLTYEARLLERGKPLAQMPLLIKEKLQG